LATGTTLRLSVRGDATVSVSPTEVLFVFLSRCVAVLPSYHHLVAMAASGDLDAANADDGDPSSSNWPRTVLDLLRGHVIEAASRPLPEPSVHNEGWQFVRKAVPQSPPRQQELESDDAEWQRPTRIEADPVVHDNVETTEFVTEAPESSSSVALKRRRYTQITIGFDTGTPLVKPPPPPPPTVTPASSPLKQTAAERAEAKFQEAQRNYMMKWLPLFDWLLIDRGDDGLHCLRCSMCSEHGPDNARYGRNGSSGRDLQPASMRAHQASTRHAECIDRQKGLLDKLAAQKKIEDYERADPEGACVVRLMRSIQFVCDEDAPIAMYPRLVEFLARDGVSDIPQHGYGVYITDCRIVAISTDGAGVMIGTERGLVVCLRQRIPHLVGTHRIAHRVLGATVVVFLEYNHKMAAVVQSLKFHFCLYFLADLLAEINALNRFFQRWKVSFNHRAAELELTSFCHIMSRHYEDADFYQGLAKMMKTKDWLRS
ncbi:unnamed protein product, partial [Closterium sp. NIES-54]